MRDKAALILSLFISIFFSGTLYFDMAFGQTNNDDFDITKNVVSISLDLTKTNMINGDSELAEKHSKFAADFFAKQVNTLRPIAPESIDEIHITLLDIHTGIISNPKHEEILTNIEKIQESFDSIKIDSIEQKSVIVSLLSIVDEQYQLAMQKNDLASYQLANALTHSSEDIFKSQTNLDDRLHLEIKSFFNDLKNLIENKESFVKVGTIITSIQRDLMGTETVVIDQQNLYEVIRQLYKQMLVAINSGDYKTAENLAIEAYLENFEYLEHDIEIVDQSLLYTLEINMREELRTMIKSNQSPDNIQLFLEQSILPDLDKAESLVLQYQSSNPNFGIDAAALTTNNLKEMGDASEQEKSGVRNEIDFIREKLESVLVYYQEGDYAAAFTSARTAYLDSYESVEIPLRGIDPDFTFEVEFQFAKLRNLIKEKAQIEDVQQAVIEIRRSLDESERLVTGTGALAPTIAFSSSFSLIFREGLESVLILGAILTYLEASRNTRFKPYVYYGVIVAIVATAVTWFVASYFIEISGASRELIEAVAALSATAVLFYVSFWILNKIETKKWMEFVKAKVWQATTTGGVMVFVMLSFFTVYREGFETVLFYQAMFSFAKYMEVYVGLGFILGIITLLIIYYGMRRIGRKLPLKALFGLTMGIGAYLSIAFLGNAIRELQTLDIISYTSMLETIPRLDINLATMTGIYPTLETLIGQIILLSVYLTAASYVLFFRPRREKQIMAMRKSRSVSNGQEKTY